MGNNWKYNHIDASERIEVKKINTSSTYTIKELEEMYCIAFNTQDRLQRPIIAIQHGKE